MLYRVRADFEKSGKDPALFDRLRSVRELEYDVSAARNRAAKDVEALRKRAEAAEAALVAARAAAAGGGGGVVGLKAAVVAGSVGVNGGAARAPVVALGDQENKQQQ